MTTAPAGSAPMSPYCLAAEELSAPEAHTRCSANGPTFLPGIPTGTAPVLPPTPCGCACHPEAGTK